MARAYQIEPLSPERASIAYPLVLAAFPTVELPQWQRYARTIANSPPDKAGVLGLRSDAGYFCGLLIYRAEREPWHGPRLSVDLFLAIDLMDVPGAMDALLAAAEAKAAALACTTVQIRVEHGPDLKSRARQAGYRPAGELMTKIVLPMPPAN